MITGFQRPMRAFALPLGTHFLVAACTAVDDASDSDCTAETAALKVALQSTISVGKGCGPGETVRDVTGTDGMVENAKDRLP